MCGRYALHSNPDVIALQFGIESPPDTEASYNIPPSSMVLVVKNSPEGKTVAGKYRWGLIPAWAKDPAIGHMLANARGESIAEKPAFRNAFRQGRCLVPASGFYEWKTTAGRKQPWYLRPKDAALFGLAGITELWNGPDGPVRTVALITTEPNELMRPIHDRMPVIIGPGDYAAWLDVKNDHPKTFLRSYPDSGMEAYPVSLRVNTPKNDDAALIERLDSRA
jgi:putative SOS response-associated peptidase YedK